MAATGILVAFALLITAAQCLRFELLPGGTKCVSEDLSVNTVVLGDYHIIEDLSHSKITARVTSPHGSSVYFAENKDKDRFAFTTAEAGNYMACFWMRNDAGNVAVNVELDWKNGYDAKDWESIAKKEKLQGMEFEIRRLDGAVEQIQEQMNYLREREETMRNITESTNALVAWFSVITLLVCVVAGGWQIWYLLSYFEHKKLL